MAERLRATFASLTPVQVIAGAARVRRACRCGFRGVAHAAFVNCAQPLVVAFWLQGRFEAASNASGRQIADSGAAMGLDGRNRPAVITDRA
jgi:hypothetical protein